MRYLDICIRCQKTPYNCKANIDNVEIISQIPPVIIDCKEFIPKPSKVCDMCNKRLSACRIRFEDILLSGGNIEECRKLEEGIK